MIQSTSWHSYPKIYALGHREVVDIFTTPIVIQEKIDGSQLSFGIINDELKIKSKSQELVIEEPEKMFKLAVDYIVSIQDKLIPGWTYRGEFLARPRHNTLCYDRIPNNHIVLFDINDGHEQYLPYQTVCTVASDIGLEVVPIFYEGIVEDPTKLVDMIKSVSFLGGNNMEGIVVKNYSLFGTDKKVLMAKYVSEGFKELNHKNFRENNPVSKDVLQLLIDSLRTPARWHKAVQHLKEGGTFDQSLRDIPNLMREVDKDIKEECIEYITEKLLGWSLPHILRGIKRGMPEWYKQYLIDEAYGKTDE